MSSLSRSQRTAPDPEILVLQALGWVCADVERADRLLSVTGLDPADLRARAGDADVLAGVARFLSDYEPDLVACATDLDVPPQQLAQAALAVANGGHDGDWA